MKFISTSISLLMAFGLIGFNAHAQVPPTSPYKTDLRFTSNKDPSADALEIVSIVACYVRNMAPEKAYTQVGTQPYVALIDVNACDSDKPESDSTSGQQSLTQSYETAVVQSSVSSDGVLDAKIWLSGKEDGEVLKTWVSAKIAGGPAKKPPFGEWEVNWCDNYNETNGTCESKGHAKVDAQGSRAWFNELNGHAGGSYQFEAAVAGQISTDEKSGGGKYRSIETEVGGLARVIDNKEGFYGFEPGLMFSSRTDLVNNSPSMEQCLVPKSNAPGAKVSSWETWLYDKSTGERYQGVNSGFSVRDAETNAWGWAGHWGVSIGNNPVVNGQRLKRVNQNDELVGTYTGFAANGKLRKITITTSNLASITDLMLKTFFPKSVITGESSDRNTWVRTTVKWDGSNFLLYDWERCSNTNCITESLQNPLTLSLSRIAGIAESNNNNLELYNLWLSLDGTNIGYNIAVAEWVQINDNWSRSAYTNPGDVVVTSRDEVVVTPGDSSFSIPPELFCLGNCVDPSLNIIQGSTVLQDDVEGPYVWDGALGILKYGNLPIDFNRAGANNFWSGVLVTSEDLSRLACKNHNGADAYCEFLADKRLTTFYRWESGPDAWNTFTGIKDESGRLVKFDSPLNVTYEVPVNDANAGAFAGKTVTIQYPGNGNLWIPGYCFDPDTVDYARTQCGEGSQWANEFTIPFDENIGVVKVPSQQNKEYLVKTLRKGVYFPPAQDPNDCNDLKDVALAFRDSVLPTESDWKNPADPNSSFYIGPWQESSQTPLVIDGELQTSN